MLPASMVDLLRLPKRIGVLAIEAEHFRRSATRKAHVDQHFALRNRFYAVGGIGSALGPFCDLGPLIGPHLSTPTSKERVLSNRERVCTADALTLLKGLRQCDDAPLRVSRGETSTVFTFAGDGTSEIAIKVIDKDAEQLIRDDQAVMSGAAALLRIASSATPQIVGRAREALHELLGIARAELDAPFESSQMLLAREVVSNSHGIAQSVPVFLEVPDRRVLVMGSAQAGTRWSVESANALRDVIAALLNRGLLHRQLFGPNVDPTDQGVVIYDWASLNRPSAPFLRDLPALVSALLREDGSEDRLAAGVSDSCSLPIDIVTSLIHQVLQIVGPSREWIAAGLIGIDRSSIGATESIKPGVTECSAMLAWMAAVSSLIFLASVHQATISPVGEEDSTEVSE
jgi:hypothetical protein